MRYGLSIIVVLLLGYPLNLLSADFNITLRKTDYQQLKEQFLPVIDQNIADLGKTYECIESGLASRQCIKQHPLVDDKILAKLDELELTADEFLHEINLLLNEAKLARECVVKSQSINQVKDCVKDNYN